VEADGLRLPFAAESFDAVTIAFGVRNLADMDAGFREMLRVLRPSGKLVILEFSTPTASLLAPAYRFYLHRVLPRIGESVSGRTGPYRYLATTISEFPEPAALAGRIREAGFGAVGWISLTGGIVALHTGLKG
jgi:demethylmenaquinone methyltransferase/2-methoxy-6-polyprenyl-1,4-benzoquinol methylase